MPYSSKYALSCIFTYSTMLNNFELEEIAQYYGFPLTVLMKDELVNLKPKSGNYIINLQSSTSGNETRRLSANIDGKNSFYMDSFGIIPPKEVIGFCKKIPNSRLAFSEIQMQEITTETCSWYAVGLLIHLNNTKNKDIFKSSGEYINQFSYDSKNNNAILKKFFRNLPKSKGFKLLSKLYSQN
jgi:hypothetical protein